MHVAAIVGYSGSGKTTLVVGLIHFYLARGLRVGAIKHTHHPMNEEHRGDTGRFRDAGADPVILAGHHEGVIFSDAGIGRTTYETPRDLLRHFDCDVVLVEGFKELGDWPKVTISAEARPSVEEMSEILDRIWRST
ncbi:MAG TPA: molybdopterin-guanine dinucleotide biosynthesis protein B [Thermoanaerobaculia bacterium]|nr:molybdopterin-guanine dinucleotide biosynthesis protein B [Thermoanaerobaculia bacterium]